MKQFPFPLSVVLTVANGESIQKAISLTTGDSLAALFGYMTGDDVFNGTNNHQMPYVMYGERVREAILRQHPFLAELDVTSYTKENRNEWLGEQVKKFGDTVVLFTQR